ncbi:MAG: hypothetical protein ABIS21_07600 [Acidimicrobiales bacterium]
MFAARDACLPLLGVGVVATAVTSIVRGQRCPASPAASNDEAGSGEQSASMLTLNDEQVGLGHRGPQLAEQPIHVLRLLICRDDLPALHRLGCPDSEATPRHSLLPVFAPRDACSPLL